MTETEFEIEFDDLTLIETEGVFDQTRDLMNEDLFAKDSWMLESGVTITSSFGSSKMLLHFYANGDIYIMEFNPSTQGDAFYNPDVRAISSWSQSVGWNRPKPFPDLARENVDFWKHFWDTWIIDSEFLDKIFGEREDFDYDII
jgi:hypothetical protein